MIKRVVFVALLCTLVAACAPQAGPTPTAPPRATVVEPTAAPKSAQPTPAPVVASLPFVVTGNTAVPLPENTPLPPIKGATFYGYHITPLGYVEYYHMDAWWVPTDKPPVGTKTNLSVSLIKNGELWLGGDIHAEWWKGDELQTSDMIVIYQRGIIDVYTDGYEPGVYVPVTATIKYLGRDYTVHTGFTPQ